MSDHFKDIHKLFGQPPSQQQQQRPSPGALGVSPGGLTNLFSDPFPESEFRSFSDLLAGAIATQLPASGELSWGSDNKGQNDQNGGDVGNSSFKQNRPVGLVLPPVAPVFNISPGFSPSAFLNSPTFLSPLGMSPQQTLAHITAQGHLNIQPDTNQHSSINSSMSNYQPTIFNSCTASRHPTVPDHPSHERRPHTNFPVAVDKPADDGYNWRKYGQKQVKGSEYPRSYYRCTTPNCPVKKKVERSFDGHITEIIYKGQHNHERPQTGRRGKDSGLLQLAAGSGSEGQFGNSVWPGGVGREHDSAQATSIQLHGPSDSEESGENSDLIEDDDYNDEPKAKRRNGGAGQSDGSFTRTTMTEPKIVVQTRSDVDLLDDGYRWRKYGQKVVKGNPNPRSYYKCTTMGCKVRKHVERASTDYSAVITTYEGKHNHDVPATRGSNNTASNIDTTQMKIHNSVGQVNFGTNNDQRPITLRLKEEELVIS
ncbi:probable WRKY transcription factor 4 [Chenopodium quinoa]|uniref:probable WRKY transcription factor 4 n=1 Tax=Chenopodium quinoa TaxID=63459 RepID=UPI000B775BFE|nr:probable WRKY transcription factor 4 [Chenopodium quinoa]